MRPAFEETLHDLQLDYLDLYLMHWPVAIKSHVHTPQTANDAYSLEEVPLSETWTAMNELKNEGLTRHIGVSNCSVKKIKQLIEENESCSRDESN